MTEERKSKQDTARKLKQAGLSYLKVAREMGISDAFAVALCHNGNNGRWMDEKCRRCGKLSQVVRHTQNYITSRFILVCNSCHSKIHGRLNRLKKKPRRFWASKVSAIKQ